MTRTEAWNLIQPHIDRSSGFGLVTYPTALGLLGDDAFAVLLRDKIRGVGPTKTGGGFYFWSVVDYLSQPQLTLSPRTVCRSTN